MLMVKPFILIMRDLIAQLIKLTIAFITLITMAIAIAIIFTNKYAAIKGDIVS